MTEVFLCKRGSIDARSRNSLRKAGVIVVEADDPSQCQFIRSGEVMSRNDMLWACLDALNHSPTYSDNGQSQRQQLVANLLRITNEARQSHEDEIEEP